MKKTIENLIFQLIYQISKIVIPIISVPIVSRALQPKGLGVYNYTLSITQYMVILAGLGVTLYGNREIAQNKNSLKDRSQIFIDIMIVKFFASAVSLLFYYLIVRNSTYLPLFIGQSLLILSVTFDISWFFMGLEDFKKVSIISLMYQFLSLLLIISLIKNSSDLMLYVYIQSIITLLSQLSIWIFLKNEIIMCRPSFINIKKHFINSFEYFIPQIAILLYTNVNKTILGSFSTKDNVAFYSNAQTINGIVITLITTLDTVLLPKMSYLSKNNERNKMLEIMKMSLQLQLFISIPACFGVVAIVPELVPWFFGTSYESLVNYIPIMSCLIIIVPIGMAISRQYLLPLGDIRGYNISIILGAVINLIINLLFIKKIGIYSSIISTISAELLVVIIRLVKFNKHESLSLDKLEILKVIASSLIMFVAIRIATHYFSLNIGMVTTLLQVLSGIFIYLLVLFLLNSRVLKFLRRVDVSK